MTFSTSIKVLFLSALTAGAVGACGSSDSTPPAGDGSTCGNNAIDGTEECDGLLLNNQTCGTKTMGMHPSGNLSCVQCHLVVTGCTGSGTAGSTGSGGAMGAAGATMMMMGNGGAPAIAGATGSGGTTSSGGGTAAGGKGGTSGTAGQAGAGGGGKGGTGGA